MQSPKVSVIVLCYQSELSLQRCCFSLFRQTLRDLEFIFVIDDPQSNCSAIILAASSQFEERKSQIRIIKNQENLGISASRAIGLVASVGEYVTFCDSDDWLEASAYSEMYSLAKSQKVDVLGCDMYQDRELAKQSIYLNLNFPNPNGFDLFNGTVLNKIFRRCFIFENNITFPPGINWGEDNCFVIQCRTTTNSLVYLPKAFYHHIIRKDSFTGTISPEKHLQLVSSAAFIEDYLNRNSLLPQYEHQLNEFKFLSKLYFLTEPKLRNLSSWYSVYPECHSEVLSYNQIPANIKIVGYLLYRNCRGVAYLLLKIRDMYCYFFHR